METDQDNTRLIDNVRTFDRDIQKFDHNVKTLKEQVGEFVENTDEHQLIIDLTEKLKLAKEQLRLALSSKSGYNDLLEKLADEKDALKSARQNMSDFLLGYFAETHERQIELGPKEAREVILKGRLGKPKDFQTNLFGREAQHE
jgi:hypothetical protein